MPAPANGCPRAAPPETAEDAVPGSGRAARLPPPPSPFAAPARAGGATGAGTATARERGQTSRGRTRRGGQGRPTGGGGAPRGREGTAGWEGEAEATELAAALTGR